MAVASASASPLPAALSSKPTARSRPPPPAFLPLRAARLGPVVIGRRFLAEAIKTQREKEQTEVAVEESFPVRETAPPEGADDPLVPTEESWVVKLEQSVNIFLTESIIMILDGFYRDRNYARFFVLETIARVPYFAFISVLHMYETFGWWRRADYIKVHFAESWNELHHLLIMEELGGNSFLVDRFLARFVAFFYYFMTVAMYMLSPRMAYHFSECVERHAYSTYDKFIKLHEEELKKLPAPEAALNYYLNEDLYLFDEFQTARVPCSRRPKIDNLYDVFVNIRDDEAEHCKTMKACQTHGNLRSPHSMQNCLETDTECVTHLAYFIIFTFTRLFSGCHYFLQWRSTCNLHMVFGPHTIYCIRYGSRRFILGDSINPSKSDFLIKPSKCLLSVNMEKFISLWCMVVTEKLATTASEGRMPYTTCTCIRSVSPVSRLKVIRDSLSLPCLTSL